MKSIFDRNLLMQIGLDSGALTMLSAVTHSFKEAGEYRGTVRNEKGDSLAVIYISVLKDSSLAHVNIDLASVIKNATSKDQNGKYEDAGNRFTVNPKGYVVFNVSEGKGGYNVHIRKAEQETQQIFDSRHLDKDDIFSGIIIRPGKYMVTNNDQKGRGELVVSYPKIEKIAYRPPAPLRVEVTEKGFIPSNIELKPGQGFSFDLKPSRG